MKYYVIDTNILYKLVDGIIRPGDLPSDGQFLATHVQIDELSRTPDIERRARLFLMFARIAPTLIPTESFVFDVSRFDQAKLGDGKFFKMLISDLDRLNGGKRNNSHDALIAEVTIVNGFTLLTFDHDLANVAKTLGASVFQPERVSQ